MADTDRRNTGTSRRLGMLKHPDDKESEVSYSEARQLLCDEWLQSQVAYRRNIIDRPVARGVIARRWGIHPSSVDNWYEKDKWMEQLNKIEPSEGIRLVPTQQEVAAAPRDTHALANVRNDLQEITGDAVVMMMRTVKLANKLLEDIESGEEDIGKYSPKDKVRLISIAATIPDQINNMMRTLGISVGPDVDPRDNAQDAIAVIMSALMTRGMNLQALVKTLQAKGTIASRDTHGMTLMDKADILDASDVVVTEGGQNGPEHGGVGPDPFACGATGAG